MSYKFVKITTFYKEYLEDYYSRNIGIKKLSYDEQYEHLMSEGFAWANFFEKHLKKIGVEAYEIIGNAIFLQKAWAKENYIKYKDEKQLIIEQLKKIKPDVIFFQNSIRYNGSFILEIKKNVPSIKKVIGWCASPYNNNHLNNFTIFDFMFSCTPKFVDELSTHGIKTYHLNHGFEASLIPLLSINNEHKETDLFFVGSIWSFEGYHNNRKELILKLLENNIKIILHTFSPKKNSLKLFFKQILYDFYNSITNSNSEDNLINKLPVFKKIKNWQARPMYDKFWDDIKGNILPPIFGLNLFKALFKSKIGLNIHIDVAGDYAGNMRLYEVPGSGSCLVTDYKKNLSDLFEIDSEVVAYKSEEECIEKIKWLLDNPNERKKIALKGQKRVLKDHTYEIRAKQLNEIILKELKIIKR